MPIESDHIDRAVLLWWNSPISPDSSKSSLVDVLGREPTDEEQREFARRARAAMAGWTRR